MKPAHFAILLAASQLCVFSQSSNQLDTQLREQSRERIADLQRQISARLTSSLAEQQLAAACAVNCDQANSQATVLVNRLIAQIHDEVDAYISIAVSTTHYRPQAVAQDLRQVLISPNDEPPFAFVLNAPKSRSLIVVYALHYWQLKFALSSVLPVPL